MIEKYKDSLSEEDLEKLLKNRNEATAKRV
jgi:hypothetical protein